MCGFIDEYMVGLSAPTAMKVPNVCPKCQKGKMEPQFSLNKNVRLNFIGAGFYCNDYGKTNTKPVTSSDHSSELL
jgi:predicted nucleic acid-binding Zn ribbon protein